VDPADGPVARFAVGLRELRRCVGSPGYRELARRAHYSATTLAQAARGASLPSLAVTLAYVRACGGEVAEWERRWRATAAELDPQQPGAPEGEGVEGERAPYVGLAAYGLADAEWFCGRDRLVASLVERVGRQRFVAVVGASGAGKSSVLRAGLLPAVAADRGSWSALVMTPGAHPLEECAVRLGSRLGIAPGPLLADFAEHPRNLGLAVRQLMSTHPDDAELLLVVDQFEEVFTLCHDAGERDRFIAALLDATHSGESRARVVVGLRADFYPHCTLHARLAATLEDAQVVVGPMSTDELGQAVTQPAARAGLMVEKTLVTTVVRDAAERPGALPFVSHALWETWKRRHGNGLFLAGYQAAGGVTGAIAHTADRVYHDLDEQHQSTARALMLRLIALGEGTEDTRRRVSRAEILDSPDQDTVTAVLDKLVAARLVTLDTDTVEIAHEALIRGWPALREWLTEDRETLRAHRQLTDAAAEWERHDRDESLLYRGARLAAWQDRPDNRLNDAEHAFLTASRRATEREHRLRRRRVRLTISGLGSATVLVTVLAVIALLMATRADNERALALSRQLVTEARAQLQLDPELGLLLAREAYTAVANDETEAVLRQATAASHIRATLPEHRDFLGRPAAATGVAFSSDGKHLAITTDDGLRVFDWHAGNITRTPPRVLHVGVVWRPVFSPDSRHIAFAGSDAVATVWDWIHAGRPARPTPNQAQELEFVWSLAYSPDGQWVASGSSQGTIRIRSAASNDQVRVLRGHTGYVDAVAFSPDGTRLASCSSEDGTIRIWDLVNGGNPLVLRSRESQVVAVTFSPDGRHLATAGVDGTVRTWDLTTTPTSTVLGNHDGTAHDVAYSADGHSIVSDGADGTVRIWNTDQHTTPIVLRGHHGTIWDVAVSPDGHTVVSVGSDGTTKIWDVDEVEDVTVLRGHEGTVSSAAPSPDKHHLATGGQDGTVRIWDLTGDSDPVTLPGPNEPITQVAYSPNGQHLAAVGVEGTVLIWNLTTSTEPTQLRLPSGEPVMQVAFNPDSTRLAAASLNDPLWVWHIPKTGHPDPSPTDVLTTGQDGGTRDITWSPDGHHIAATQGNKVLMWNLPTDTQPTQLRSHQGTIFGLNFSPDGTHLASGSNDGTINLWNLTTRTAEPTILRSRQGADGNITFSLDGHHIAASGNTTTVTIWKTEDTGEPLTLDGFPAPVTTITTLDDDRYITTHTDGTIRIWRCPACGTMTEVLATAKRHTTRQLTPDERRTYLPDNP
jgi:WD40 repeat protein